jgi:ABC-2 type transport system ATP-binding protein
MTKSVIEVSDLVVEYQSSKGSVRAVDGLDLHIAAGEVYALLGENGAGKTSTVEVIEGHRRRLSGQVKVLGIDPAATGRYRRELRDQIGIVLQASGIEPEITAREALTLFRSPYRNPRTIDEVVELVDLREFVDQRVSTLSGGQRRRLDLAVAVIGRPKVLFLDEPTTGFDPSARRRAWDLISTLRAGGTTILLTTHYLEEAEFLADRVGVISRGRMLIEGSPRDLQQAHGQRVMSVDIVGGGSGVDEDLQAGLSQALAGVAEEIEWIGSRVHVTSSDTNAALERLTKWAAASGVILNEWSIERPSLEQVFLKVNSDEIEGDSRG